MKRFLSVFVCLVLLLTACSNKQSAESTIAPAYSEPEPQVTTTQAPEQEITEPMMPDEYTELLAVSMPALTETFTADDGTELFSYTAQSMQLIHPDGVIADNVMLDFFNRLDAVQEEVQHVFSSAKANYAGSENWYPYFYQIIYSPTRIDHGVLSLFGTQNSYSGAQHGNLSCVAANYDLTTGDVLTLGSIMHMDATTDDFIALLIPKLAAMADELGLFEGYEEGVQSRLSGDENLYEDFFFTNTGLSFFFAPYEIAPYASGVITVEIPYEELPGLIYDGYFPEEREHVEGKLTSGLFMTTDMEQFNSMAEVTFAEGESIIVIYPEGKVEDIRIVAAGDGKNKPSYTAFAALEMSPNNAVLLGVTQEDAKYISIEYMTEGSLKTLSFAE